MTKTKITLGARQGALQFAGEASSAFKFRLCALGGVVLEWMSGLAQNGVLQQSKRQLAQIVSTDATAVLGEPTRSEGAK